MNKDRESMTKLQRVSTKRDTERESMNRDTERVWTNRDI